MSRTACPLFAVFSLPLVLLACGAADALSPELPFDAGADQGTADAAADQAAAGDQTSPPPDSGPEVQPEAAAQPDALPIHDGAIPDTGAKATKTCLAQGGVLCTEARWELCPPGFEPVAAGDGHFNCGMTHEGWCCQPAPISSCTMSGVANCVPNACTGCFAPSPDTTLQCEPGRACCVDMCF